MWQQMDDPSVRRDFIKHRYGIDLSSPFELLVFPDDTTMWRPVTILLAWLTVALAEQHGDIDPGDAFRVAQARIRKLYPEDWDEFLMQARAWGIRLADADETQKAEA